MQLVAWDPPQLQTDVRHRHLPSSACAPHTLTRPAPLAARRTNAVLTVKDVHGCHRYCRGAHLHFPLYLIILNTESAVGQDVTRYAHALALGRRLCQGSVGKQLGLAYVQSVKYFFPL